MDREKALNILSRGREGVKEWNLWREDGHKPPDLSLADLVGADLRFANLHSLELRGANLRGANLTFANLSYARLRGADLRETTLRLANLDRAELSGVDVSGASMGFTILGTDLSKVKGLSSVTHDVPSHLTVECLFLTRASLPDSFLRGCGIHPRTHLIMKGDAQALTEAVYEAERKPIALNTCFISYSTRDRTFVKHLREGLNSEGVDYWYSDEHMIDGASLVDQIDRAIALRDRTVLVVSRHSLSSGWVGLEIEKALEEEDRRRHAQRRNWRVLFPVMIDDTFLKSADPHMALLRKDRKASDFRRARKGEAFRERLASLVKGLRMDQEERDR